jgi:hypothetical protein
VGFLIRDHQKVYREVEEPYAVFHKGCWTLYKIGEKEHMESYFEFVTNRYRAFGFHGEADEIILMELPKDQEEIDKVFGIVDYIGKLYQQRMLH